VAITGAAGVGTIMGTFSSDVSGESDTVALRSASSNEIVVAGSTTVQPVSEFIAEAYMTDHTGVKITVQGGGSGAGISSAGLGYVDIGAASRDMKSTEKAKYPDMEVHPIGGSAVVLIAHKDVVVSTTGDYVNRTNVIEAYTNGSFTTLAAQADITKAFQRADASGTEDTFTDWLKNDTFDSDIEGKVGNAGVLAAVKDTPNSMGFVDYGFAADGASVTGVQILGIGDDGRSGRIYNATDITSDNLKDALKDEDDSKYPTGKVGPNSIPGLTRPLNYMTGSEPTPMVQNFIYFAQSPGAIPYFTECGYFAYTEIA
jgi:phosphate transport system substrate-binding protein